MGKLTIQEIAKVLVGKNGLDQRAANRFATEMFAVILERLQQGEQVKVKGLGTWKIIDVEARESVSVRTGERVVIDGHAKVTFTPDATMKELVNKPFSQFETVVLNDGVEFDDMKEEMPADDGLKAEVTENAEVVESAEVVETAVDVPIVVEEFVEEPMPVPVAPVEEQKQEQEEETPAPAVEEELTREEDDHESHHGKWLLGGMGVIALMAASAWGGYQYGKSQLAVTVPVDTIVVTDTVFVASADTLVVAEPASAVAEEPQPDPYAAKDERVRLGAYRIIGLDREVKVQPGQTFYSICRGNLGPDMECYVEVYNGLPRNPNIKVGQTIKIPKLQLKKRRKQ